MNKQDELFKKCFMKTLKKLAEEPDEVINYNEQLKKYNNVLKEKNKLEQELQRKDNIISELKQNKRDYERENILEMKLHILDNNWNELKNFLIDLQKLKGINQQGFSWGVCQEILDKIKELERGR